MVRNMVACSGDGQFFRGVGAVGPEHLLIPPVSHSCSWGGADGGCIPLELTSTSPAGVSVEPSVETPLPAKKVDTKVAFHRFIDI